MNGMLVTYLYGKAMLNWVDRIRSGLDSASDSKKLQANQKRG